MLDAQVSEIKKCGPGTNGILIDASSTLLVDVASLKLDGTGKLALNGGTITGQAANAGNELENFDNTIRSDERRGGIDRDNDEAGIIDDNGGTLKLHSGTVIDNAGLL